MLFPPGSSWAFPPGGGGGDPLEREPAAVLDDVLDGYLSAEAELRDYGLVLMADGTGVDSEATRKEREGRRKG